MSIKVGINGFGRIGRLLLRATFRKFAGPSVVAINEPGTTIEHLAYMIKYDSTHGRYKGKICVGKNFLLINNTKIMVFNETDPSKIKWCDAGAEWVVESSGMFTEMAQASKHLEGGAKKVIISAPSKDAPMFVVGANLKQYKPDMRVISNASCTTNCLTLIAKIVHDNYQITEGLMTTLHAVTGGQKCVDMASAKSWRIGRGCIQNIIPTSTDVTEALGKIMPELAGKLNGMSIRVPVANVSAVDLTVRLKKQVQMDALKKKFCEAAEKELKGILGYTEEEVVSTDFNTDARSAIFDAKASIALNPNFIKVVAWYDNEWGYANRLIDLMTHAQNEDCKAEQNKEQNKDNKEKKENKGKKENKEKKK